MCFDQRKKEITVYFFYEIKYMIVHTVRQFIAVAHYHTKNNSVRLVFQRYH